MTPIFSITDYAIEEPKKPYPIHFYVESDYYNFPRIPGELHFSIIADRVGTCNCIVCSKCPFSNKGCSSVAKILSVVDHYLPDAKPLHPEFFV